MYGHTSVFYQIQFLAPATDDTRVAFKSKQHILILTPAQEETLWLNSKQSFTVAHHLENMSTSRIPGNDDGIEAWRVATSQDSTVDRTSLPVPLGACSQALSAPSSRQAPSDGHIWWSHMMVSTTEAWPLPVQNCIRQQTIYLFSAGFVWNSNKQDNPPHYLLLEDK